MADRPKHLEIGDAILWTIIVIDPDGEPIDSLAIPTISVRKNGVAIGDTPVVVRRTTGVYDAAYLPAVSPQEGDQFTLEEFIQVNFGQGVSSHKNAWEFIVNPVDPSGPGARLITGTVQDNDLAKVSGATVEVLDGGGTSLGYFDTTDTLGIFNFNLNDGDYIFLIAALAGYQTDTGTAYSVSVSQTTPLLTLNKAEVVVDPVDPNAIDMTGMKRVKTKHMEIEAFDPRIMQDVRDRELAPPSFCNLDMCKGVPARGCGSYRRGCY